MYKRKSLERTSDAPKKKNEHNRNRNVIVNFRMSLQEKAMLDNRIKLSGLQKQDYFISSVLNQKIVTVGNIKVFEEIWKCLYDIRENLVNSNTFLDEIKISSIKTICEIISGIGEFEDFKNEYEIKTALYKKKVLASNKDTM